MEKAAQLQYGELQDFSSSWKSRNVTLKKETDVLFMKLLQMMRLQGLFPDGQGYRLQD